MHMRACGILIISTNVLKKLHSEDDLDQTTCACGIKTCYFILWWDEKSNCSRELIDFAWQTNKTLLLINSKANTNAIKWDQARNREKTTTMSTTTTTTTATEMYTSMHFSSLYVFHFHHYYVLPGGPHHVWQLSIICQTIIVCVLHKLCMQIKMLYNIYYF
jgi:hypothetical protein